MVRLLTLLALLFAIGGGVAAAAEPLPVPPLQGRINDLSGALTADQRSRVEAAILRYEQGSGAQLAVLLLPTTAPEPIEAFGIRVADVWKLGRRGVDDGIIILVATADRRLRIEVGYGLEGVVPDAVAKRIVSETVAPRFAQGDLAGGLVAAVETLTRIVTASGTPPAAARPAGRDDFGGEGLLLAAFVAAAVIGRALRYLLGDLPGASVTGAGTGVVGWLLTGSPLIAGVAALGGFFVALFGLSLALNLLSSGRGGGRGGGFSGGGGGFGGGGASGRW